MNSKKWTLKYTTAVLCMLVLIAGLVVFIDPYFHYHAPIKNLYYTLSEERNINDGIAKRFKYDAIITGTSMTENFNTSKAEELFSYDFVKLPYPGGTYKEINTAEETALNSENNLKMIIRGIDMSHLMDDKDAMRHDLGEYPTYLYDDNPFNDINYIMNKRAVLHSAMNILLTIQNGPGCDSFDEYSNWMEEYTFGADEVLKRKDSFTPPETIGELTKKERKTIRENITQNLTVTPSQYSDVKFYYFIPPYSLAWWGQINGDGDLERYLEAEKLCIEELLKFDNIKLFSFNDNFDLTGNLNNYKDSMHYGEDINNYILESMQNGTGLITRENYREYLQKEQLHRDFDYNSLFAQKSETSD